MSRPADHPSRRGASLAPLLPVVPRPATQTTTAVSGPANESSPLRSPTVRAAASAEIEQRFLSGVSTESISDIHRQVTEHPHIAGSARSMEVADRLRRALDAAGPADRSARVRRAPLDAPFGRRSTSFRPWPEPLVVREPASPRDPDSADPELGPAFVAYSASGTVTGAGRLCQLRAAARLRAARRGRHGRARQDRHRSIRAQPSRRQDSHRGKGGRGRHHHLFGSGRRWLCARSDVAGGAVARGLSNAERQRQVQLVLARRSADARGRRDGRCARRSIRRRRRRCRGFPPWCCRGKRRRRSCRS